MTAELIKENEWIVTDEAGEKVRVFCRADENTAAAAIALVKDFFLQEAE